MSEPTTPPLPPDDQARREQERHPPAAADAPQGTVTYRDLGATQTYEPRGGTPRRQPSPDLPGYGILGELGRGGMGVVYKARQLSLNRLVALKVISAGVHAGHEELARFRAEAEVVGKLQHPHIVQIFEVGEHDGLPYCALEFVEGGSLAARLGGSPLPAREAARLVGVLAAAVDAAHRAGIVHRDLKPANVLLASGGCEPPAADKTGSSHPPLADLVPKVADFGLAKQLGGDAGQTQTGAIMGTPSYMAPEQASGRSKEVGPLCDVYALGAILYECLTGRPPFKAATVLETLEQVRGQEPVPPRQLNAAVPRDLETIALKCLHKEPQRRYASAADLAADLNRFLEGRPIIARTVGRLEKTVKWARRKPASAALLGLSLAGLVALAAGLVWHDAQMQYERGLEEKARAEAETESERARIQQARAERGEKEAGEKGRLALEQAAIARAQQVRAEVREEEASRGRLANQVLRVRGLWEHDPGQAMELLESTVACPLHLRDFVWGYYHELCRRDRLTLYHYGHVPRCVALSPDGRTLASGGSSRAGGNRWAGGVQLWDLTTGKERFVLRGHSKPVTAVAFSPDGRWIASGGEDRTVRLWRAAGGSPGYLAGNDLPQEVRTVAFSPDGRFLAAALGKRGSPPAPGEVRVWNVATGGLHATFKGHGRGVLCVAFSSDGRLLAAGSSLETPNGYFHGDVWVWDTASGRRRQRFGRFFSAEVVGLAFRPGARELAVASADASGREGEAGLWDVASGQLRTSLKGVRARVNALAFSTDGKRLATAHEGAPGSVSLWDPETGKETLTLPGSGSGLALSPDGRWLASVGSDAAGGGSAVRLWNLSPQEVPPTFRLPPNVASVAFGPGSAGGAWTLAAGMGKEDGHVIRLLGPGGRPHAGLGGRHPGQSSRPRGHRPVGSSHRRGTRDVARPCRRGHLPRLRPRRQGAGLREPGPHDHLLGREAERNAAR